MMDYFIRSLFNIIFVDFLNWLTVKQSAARRIIVLFTCLLTKAFQFYWVHFEVIVRLLCFCFLMICCLCFVEYTDDEAEIEKLSSVVVRRIPLHFVKPAPRELIVYVWSYYWFYDESVKSLMILCHWFIYIRFPSDTC